MSLTSAPVDTANVTVIGVYSARESRQFQEGNEIAQSIDENRYMSRRSDQYLLSDIKEAAQRIATYTAKTSHKAFLGDAKTQPEVVVKGEAIERDNK